MNMQRMKKIDIAAASGLSGKEVTAAVLFDQGAVKVRRIELSAGARIPPCRMRDDVVFAVIAGRVVFRSGRERLEAAAPGAVFIPGGAAARSMVAREPSLVLAVLCRRENRAGTRMRGNK